MSQHYLEFERSGRKCLLMMGWDKPMQEAYLTAGYYTDDKSDWEMPLFIERSIPFDRENNIVHVDEITIHFAGLLQTIGIEVPDDLFKGVVEDIASNQVNMMYLYEANGTRKQLEEQPFKESQ